MKANVLISLSLILSIQFVAAKSQQEGVTQPLQVAVNRLDKVKTTEDLIEVRNLFQRLCISSPEEWLTCYYQCYTDILLVFRSTEETQQQQWLQDAQTCLDKLKKIKCLSNAEQSEISTLKGFFYYAQMSINPSVNGPKLSSVSIAAYAEALKLNPENPRAIVLNAYLQQSMSSFMGGNYSGLESDIEKARALYSKEDKTGLFPHWYMEI